MIFRNSKIRSFGLLAASLALVIGCGGGGGSSTTTSGSSSINLFATDNLQAGYDHVWVTLYRVELTGPSGTRVVFDEPAGRQVDLRSLRDDVGRRFRLLGKRAVANGNYTSLSVTLGENVSIFTTGSTSATPGAFEGSSGGRKVLSLGLGSTAVNGSRSLIVDFDLANWNLEGSTVSATGGAYLRLVTDDSSLSNIDRHDRDDYKGAVSSLSGTAPTQSFTLTTGGSTVTVTTDANTVIYNSNGATSPVLANGQTVEVYGSYSTADNALIASRVKIEDASGEDESEMLAKIVRFESTSNQITVSVLRTEGFQPPTTEITLSYADTARFFGRRGTVLTVDQFEAQLAVDGYLEVEGAMNGEGFTATKLKTEGGDDHSANHDGGNHVGEAEARGAVSASDLELGTLTMVVSEWEGMNLGANRSLSVQVAEQAEYKIDGENVSASSFFAALTSGSVSVKVEGTYDTSSGVLTARELKIGAGGGGGGNDD